MPDVMTTIDFGLHAVLDDLSHEIEFARGPGGSWFGVFTMQPLSLSDFGVRHLLELGLIDVLEWDDGPDGCRFGWRYERVGPVRTRSRPSRARLSTDGWAILDRY